MNDAEIRRVRRIIEEALPRTAPQQPPPPPTRQAERFQRAIGAVRRSEPAAPPRTEKARAPAPRTDPPSPSPTVARPARPALPPIPGIVSAEADDAPLLAQTDIPPMPWPSSAAWSGPPDGWEHALADTIVQLCQGSDPSFHSWTILVPLPPETLPHTELRLSLSPHRLQLRFHVQSTRALAIVSSHCDTLRNQLAEALSDARHIDIDIT